MSGEVKQNTSVASGAIAVAPTATESASNPTAAENPADVGAEWHNTTSGQIFICTDNTINSNTWIGQKDSLVAGGRGLFAGGTNTSDTNINEIGYVEISTLGNATDFGDLATATAQIAGTSNSINDRGLIAVSYTHLRAHET